VRLVLRLRRRRRGEPATVAIGTETDGSIVCPSGQNGVVGIKPTLGLVSRSGVVPISAEQDTAGPIAKHVVDAALDPRGHPRHRPDRRATRDAEAVPQTSTCSRA
jgi:Asp-tRNA(Asn)/Glu-tRNA(Gln) amidotransferase A subunit family amidase